MIYRDYLLEYALNSLKHFPFLHKPVNTLFEYVTRSRIILFARHPEKLYASLAYIKNNETSRRITIVFFVKQTLMIPINRYRYSNNILRFLKTHKFFLI